MADSWALHHIKPHDGNDVRSVAPPAYKMQWQFERKHGKLILPRATLRRRQIAITNVVGFGAMSVSSLTGMRSRHDTKSNAVVKQTSSISKLSHSDCQAHRLGNWSGDNKFAIKSLNDW